MMNDFFNVSQEQEKKVAQQEIAKINEKLKECNNLKEKFTRYKKKLENEIDSWKRAQRKLSSGSKCAKVVITDQFEGEMAKGLKSYMDQVKKDIKSGISAAEALSEDTQTQINALEAYSNSLKTQKNICAAKL